jgi:hypothetical protein
MFDHQYSKPYKKYEHHLFSSIPFSFLLFLSVLCALCGSFKKISLTNLLTLIIMSNLFETWSFGFEITIHSRGWQIPESVEQSQSKIQNPKSQIA